MGVEAWESGFRDDNRYLARLRLTYWIHFCEHAFRYGFVALRINEGDSSYHSLITCCCLLGFNSVWSTHVLNFDGSPTWCTWSLNVSSETGSVQQAHHIQDLIIQNLWLSEWEVNHKGTDLPTWTPGTNACWCIHSPLYPQWLNVFGYMVRLQKTQNKLLRQRHVCSALLELWLVWAWNIPALVQGNIPPPYLLFLCTWISHFHISDNFFPHDVKRKIARAFWLP